MSSNRASPVRVVSILLVGLTLLLATRQRATAAQPANLEQLRKSAEAGDADAMNSLGEAYDFGRIVARNDPEAAKWFKKSADAGNPLGMKNLGNFYRDGRGGLPQDPKQAAEWFQKGSDLGNAKAMNNLGFLYEHGIGVEKSTEKALKLFEASSEKGEPVAMRNLARMYEQGEGVKKDATKADEWRRRATETDRKNAEADPLAAASLGLQYLYGRGVERNPTEAMKWLQKSADMGNTAAMVTIGQVYASGAGISQADPKQAVAWYQKAADAGDPAGIHRLAMAAMDGFGVPMDRAAGINLFKKAAAMGHAPAMASLGGIYGADDAPEHNDAEAVKWNQKGADLKDAGAMTNLGYEYSEGRGVKKDLEAAFHLYQDAAALGTPMAMNNLATAYLEGYGVKPNEAEAVKWYQKAADLGNVRAMTTLATLYRKGRGVPKDSHKADEWQKKVDAATKRTVSSKEPTTPAPAILATSQPTHGTGLLQTCLAAAADWTPVYPSNKLPAAKEIVAVFKVAPGEHPKRMEAHWIAVEVNGFEPNAVMTKQQINNLSAGLLKLSSPKEIPQGKYRLDVTADDQTWKSVDFQVVAPIAQPPLAAATDLVSLTQGKTLKYDFEQQSGGDVKLLLDDLAPGADGIVHTPVTATIADIDEQLGAHLELRRKDKVVSEEWWKIDPKHGLIATQRKVGEETLKLDPPQLLWPWPLKTPKSWTYQPKDKSYKLESRMWGPLPLQVSGKSVTGYVILLEQSQGKSKLTCERHFAPGLGLVREIIINARDGEMISTQRTILSPDK